LVDLIVSGNTTATGKGYGGAGILVIGGAPTFERVVVSGNSIPCSGEWCWNSGAGMALYGSDAILQDVVVRWNLGGWYGGGVYLEESDAVFSNVSVTHNESDSGGGIAVDSGAPTFSNVLIADNVGRDGDGGGIALYTSDATLTNVIIQGNSAAASTNPKGGGVDVYFGGTTFVNVVVADNQARCFDGMRGSGGGIYVEGIDTVITYSDFHQNYPTNVTGIDDPTGTFGNITVDPAFLDAAFHLEGSSPLIDAGDPTLLDPDGSPSDMGAFGGAGAGNWDLDGDGYASWWLPGAYDPASSPGMDCDDADASVFPGSGC
jgi:hypothetical protein